MNAAHAHLIINHFPIVGIILACLVLVLGVLLKSSVTKRIGFMLFLIAGITSVISFKTGEEAEDLYEDYVEKTTLAIDSPKTIEMTVANSEKVHHLIHEHEEKAEGFMPLAWGLIFLSIIGLILDFKKKSMANAASLVVLIVGLLAVYFAWEVGSSGGEIAHPEIHIVDLDD